MLVHIDGINIEDLEEKYNELAVLLLGGFPIHCWMANREVVFRLPKNAKEISSN